MSRHAIVPFSALSQSGNWSADKAITIAERAGDKKVLITAETWREIEDELMTEATNLVDEAWAMRVRAAELERKARRFEARATKITGKSVKYIKDQKC